MYTLQRSQVIPTDLETAWSFIEDPRNLDRITPEDMRFEIVTDIPATMFNGLLIEYRIDLPDIGRQKWVTEIKHIRPQQSFVDEQRIGPYSMWFHYHEIEAVEGGVLFKDQVNYVPPFGPIGQLVHSLYIRERLRTIFDYRAVSMREHLS